MKMKRYFSIMGIPFLIMMTAAGMTACGMKNSEPAAEESVQESVSVEAEPESLTESMVESLPESLPDSIRESISESIPETTPEPEADVQQEEPAPEPPEPYKYLVGDDAQRAYDADETYSLTWNPDGSSQYDTITATLQGMAACTAACQSFSMGMSKDGLSLWGPMYWKIITISAECPCNKLNVFTYFKAL